MIDIHSHLLPYMDDGSDSVETTINMLNEYQAQGVTTIVATPHFYANTTSVESFLKKRDASYKKLEDYIKNNHIKDMPKIIKGAEIHLTHNILNLDDIDKLKIEGTDYALLELPYDLLGSWVVNTIYEFSLKFNVTPVIVHLERYLANHKNRKVIDEVLKLNLPIQINADSVLDFRLFKNVKNLIKHQNVCFIAGDAHNTTTRKVQIKKSLNKLQSKFGADFTNRLISNSEKLINNEFEI